jgi:transcriptional regulator with XRE-family HTH domain
MPSPSTFGSFVCTKRQALEMTQKDLAIALSLSPQYLNDIEHDRRSPSDAGFIEKLASVLRMTDKVDYLYYLAGKIPEDIRLQNLQPDDVVSVMRSFRRS